MRGRPLIAAAVVTGALLAASCGGTTADDSATDPGVDPAADVSTTASGVPSGTAPAAGGAPAPTEPPSTATTTPDPPTSVAPTTVPAVPAAPDELPAVPTDPAALATEITTVERAIRDPATPAAELADLGHRQQFAYRTLSVNPAWDADVMGALPDDLRIVATLNVSAPRQALGMFGRLGTKLPAWTIVAPEPADALLSYYREAEAETGVDWEVLAAINLVETGMGRIQGLSSAGAQGPMQFIAPTWEAWGEGDVNNPRDAIRAAARYLQDRGAPADYPKAIWAYNNHNNYVRAVTAYADVMRGDERAFLGYYHWQIHHYSEAGDLWLREGYSQPEPVVAVQWAAANPDKVAGPPPPAELFRR